VFFFFSFFDALFIGLIQQQRQNKIMEQKRSVKHKKASRE